MNDIVQQDIAWLIQNTEWQEFKNAKILITGAGGFIARYLVHFFMELNREKNVECHVYALVRDRNKARGIFKDWIENSHFHMQMGNVEDSGTLAKDMTYVFHAAGISSTKMFDSHPVDVLSANVIGTHQLLENAKDNHELKKYVFFSSGSVYGNPPEAYMPFDENVYYSLNPFQTGGCYAEGKRVGELWCHSYWKQYGIPTAMVRIGHTYGPGIDLYAGNIYSDIVKSLLEKKNIEIRNPLAVRPFTYVRDTIWGILLVALSQSNGEAYNLWNTRERISVGKLVDELVNQVFADRGVKVYCNGEVYCHDEANDNKDSNRKSDTQKIEKLGWNAGVGVKEGFCRTVHSFEI